MYFVYDASSGPIQINFQHPKLAGGGFPSAHGNSHVHGPNGYFDCSRTTTYNQSTGVESVLLYASTPGVWKVELTNASSVIKGVVALNIVEKTFDVTAPTKSP